MADAAQIAELRGLINEPTADPYTDAALAARIDAATGTVRALAGQVWREKAAAYAGLVDVKEGSSDRKLSQLYTQALRMADSFSVDDSPAPARTSRTRQIVRQ